MGRKKSSSQQPTLDLHGYATHEVFDAVDAFLMKTSQKDARRARIMTGRGSGKVQNAVIDYLKQAHYPWQYEKLDSGQVNKGVIVVFLD